MLCFGLDWFKRLAFNSLRLIQDGDYGLYFRAMKRCFLLGGGMTGMMGFGGHDYVELTNLTLKIPSYPSLYYEIKHH